MEYKEGKFMLFSQGEFLDEDENTKTYDLNCIIPILFQIHSLLERHGPARSHLPATHCPRNRAGQDLWG